MTLNKNILSEALPASTPDQEDPQRKQYIAQNNESVDFGYESIAEAEKPKRVDAVFESVSAQYNLMNDMMSLGWHRLWKAFTVVISQIKPKDRILDIATGTGDLAYRMLKKLGSTGKMVLLDRSQPMLVRARDRLLDKGYAEHNIQIIQGDAEQLPFLNDYFDHITLGFGLRNVTRQKKALTAMHRVLKPGGQLLILEFSKPPSEWLNKLYDAYSFFWIPKLGQWILNDRASYQYLVESIRRHPDAETLRQHILEAGFHRCSYHRLSGGIVALHRAWKD